MVKKTLLETHIEAAKNEAKKSTMNQQHGCVIIKDGKIISRGHNFITDEMCHLHSVHSEVAAINNLMKWQKTKKYLEEAIMIVVRITGKKQQFNLSSPCDSCTKYIKKHGIGTIFYTS